MTTAVFSRRGVNGPGRGRAPCRGWHPGGPCALFITFGVWCEWMLGARVEKVRLGDSVHCLPQMVWSWWILNISRKGEVSCVPLPHNMPMAPHPLLSGDLPWLLSAHLIGSVLKCTSPYCSKSSGPWHRAALPRARCGRTYAPSLVPSMRQQSLAQGRWQKSRREALVL